MKFSQIKKSSRHSKITGDFAEHLVLYWLSKHGFECARIDHTGIDLLARDPKTKKLLGISVKSRSRNPGSETDTISIPNEELGKIEEACKAFGCVPYFAIVADTDEIIQVFLMSLKNFLSFASHGKKTLGWKMRERDLARYWRAVPRKLYAFAFYYRNYQ